MASDRHMEAALAVVDSVRGSFKQADFEAGPYSVVKLLRERYAEAISEALAQAERDGLRRAAAICRREEATYLSPEYTTDQPLGSVSERIACRTCAAAILVEAGESDQ